MDSVPLIPLPHPAPGALPSPRLSPDGAGRALRHGAQQVLLGNWTGASTVPSRTLYPHQWSWDSAFVAIGLRHFSPGRARGELETLLAAQWLDGRVPHIVFNPSVPLGSYFPGPDFWRSGGAATGAGSPARTETSGIVQPPVHALAAWLVHEADPAGSARSGFLARVYPRLAAWHRYLTTARDLGGAGLASVVHPWESGMDNSPCWDGPLDRIEPVDPRAFRRADLAHGAADHRPTDLDYGRYVRLAADYRDHGYSDTDAPHRFAVEDPCLNALLIVSELALARIARETGADADAHERHAARLTAALVERLWDAESGMFLCRDVRDGEGGTLIRERSVAGLVPLIVPGLPGHVVAAMVATAHGERFALGRLAMVPSYDLHGESFHPSRYWRGPAWFNTNWLIERGLRLHGATEQADALRSGLFAAAGASGFAEYVDPFTGRACGARSFSWTAALTVDLLDGPDDHFPLGTPGGAPGLSVPAPRTASAAAPAVIAAEASAARR
ncbi:MGH1-like glycoside hydrolase domain-containing protein [Streptomyces thermolineatus]|uniref:MGH1-like glycoside hydrolase domain-containing protein n=1 Tax=Streptomyces thermolineatus TaxID=44033 RepID=UPI00384B11AC